MNYKVFLVFSVFTYLCNAQEQQQTFQFSLQQAIDHAIENNYAAINAKRDIEAAKQKNGKQPRLVCHKFLVTCSI